MAWKLENIRKDPNSKEKYADLFTSQIKEEPKTACLFTIGDARTVEIILEKYKNTQFVVFDYPALIKFLEFAKPANLLKAVPLKYDWESEDVFLKFVEEELQNYIINNMSFDLIIANPPYGLSNSIAKKIIPVLLEKAKDVVVLVPKNTYKSKDLWEKVVKINVIKENLFEDASVQNLTVAKLSKDNSKNKLDFEELILTEKQKVLRKAIKAYNTSHPTKLIRKVPFGNKVDPKIYKIGEVTLEEAIKQGRIFANTVWTPLDGVHTNQAHDWVCNLQNKWPKEYFDKMPVNLTLFPGKQERDNFSKWWYSCLEKEQGKKLRSGLTNACLDLIRDCRSANGEGYLELFPQVDWSRSWTDAEILKELGLPEDFLKENV